MSVDDSVREDLVMTEDSYGVLRLPCAFYAHVFLSLKSA